MAYELTTLSPRSYQTEALTWARQRDRAVVCLPTGTGKTLVGCQWACERLTQAESDRILVLKPSRFLVEQGHQYITTHTNIPAEKLYGTTFQRPFVGENGGWKTRALGSRPIRLVS